MKCLVTGAAGGIGHHLCERLMDYGHDVIGLDNFSTGNHRGICEIIEGDVETWGEKEYPFPFDWIFHLAAKADIVPSIENPVEYHRTNVNGTINMLEYARRIKAKRFVYAASASCFGNEPEVPTPEHGEIKCVYPYALTKHVGELYVHHYGRVYNLSTTSLRFFNVYGPGFRKNGAYGAVFGVFLSQLAQGKPLTVVGNGKQKRDFIYVSDVVEALIKAADSPHRYNFNIGLGESHSINQLVKLLGDPDVIHIPDRPGEPKETKADIWLAQELLGWTPKVSFKEGVQKMLEHLDEYKTADVWTPEKIDLATKQWFHYLEGK